MKEPNGNCILKKKEEIENKGKITNEKCVKREMKITTMKENWIKTRKESRFSGCE